MDIPSQSAITEGTRLPSLIFKNYLNYYVDNVTLHLDGVLYYRVIDPYLVRVIFMITSS